MRPSGRTSIPVGDQGGPHLAHSSPPTQRTPEGLPPAKETSCLRRRAERLANLFQFGRFGFEPLAKRAEARQLRSGAAWGERRRVARSAGFRHRPEFPGGPFREFGQTPHDPADLCLAHAERPGQQPALATLKYVDLRQPGVVMLGAGVFEKMLGEVFAPLVAGANLFARGARLQAPTAEKKRHERIRNVELVVVVHEVDLPRRRTGDALGVSPLLRNDQPSRCFARKLFEVHWLGRAIEHPGLARRRANRRLAAYFLAGSSSASPLDSAAPAAVLISTGRTAPFSNMS